MTLALSLDDKGACNACASSRREGRPSPFFDLDLRLSFDGLSQSACGYSLFGCCAGRAGLRAPPCRWVQLHRSGPQRPDTRGRGPSIAFQEYSLLLPFTSGLRGPGCPRPQLKHELKPHLCGAAASLVACKSRPHGLTSASPTLHWRFGKSQKRQSSDITCQT